jgi:hypothetical protein
MANVVLPLPLPFPRKTLMPKTPLQRCPKCRRNLPLECFVPSYRGKNGRQCKQCINDHKRERYLTDPSYQASQKTSAFKQYWGQPHTDFFRERRNFASRRSRCNYEFSFEEYWALREKTNHTCPVYKQPFQHGHKKWGASIDRIDSTKGYTLDNIQVVSVFANTVKSSATYRELVTMGKWAEAQLSFGS